MQSEIPIRPVGFPERDLLIEMYDRFDPIGVAQGLPPHGPHRRREWVSSALHHRVNLAGFTRSGSLAGHCFLATTDDDATAVELAIFVHQDYRRRGLGTALTQAALDHAVRTGFTRVWCLASSDNSAALRLLRRCGFRVRNSDVPEIELEIDLSPVLVEP